MSKISNIHFYHATVCNEKGSSYKNIINYYYNHLKLCFIKFKSKMSKKNYEVKINK